MSKKEAEQLDIMVSQHETIGKLQWELVEEASLKSQLVVLLLGYQKGHDQADPWGHCTCDYCKLVDKMKGNE